jgi:hypothetical protein
MGKLTGKNQMLLKLPGLKASIADYKVLRKCQEAGNVHR